MKNRCFGCMRIKQQSPRCEHCGFVEGTPNELHQLQVGAVLREQYTVGKALGQGGFGITYVGWDQYLDSPVAIKEYYPSGQVSRNGVTSSAVTCNTAPYQFQEGCDRFMKEARTLAKLQNVGNIVKVSGFFKENNTAYIVMEYVQGMTLLQYIQQRGGRLTASETFAVLRPVMQALHQVHEAGMIHRDISPDNIMLQDNGTVKILDFGTARDTDSAGLMTHSTQAVLKHGFAPMEQYATGRAVDRRADEYALCATVYCCLTGTVPPDAPSQVMDGAQIQWDSVPGLSENQRQVLKKGTATRAEDRYPDLRALEDALFGAASEPTAQISEAPRMKEYTPVQIPETRPMQEQTSVQVSEAPRVKEYAPVQIPETRPMPEQTSVKIPETRPLEPEQSGKTTGLSGRTTSFIAAICLLIVFFWAQEYLNISRYFGLLSSAKKFYTAAMWGILCIKPLINAGIILPMFIGKKNSAVLVSVGAAFVHRAMGLALLMMRSGPLIIIDGLLMETIHAFAFELFVFTALFVFALFACVPSLRGKLKSVKRIWWMPGVLQFVGMVLISMYGIRWYDLFSVAGYTFMGLWLTKED